MVQGVEVEIEGERWVRDLANERFADDTGDEELASVKGKERERDWNEDWGTGSMMGVWRRRRWIRTVRRQVVGNQE